MVPASPERRETNDSTKQNRKVSPKGTNANNRVASREGSVQRLGSITQNAGMNSLLKSPIKNSMLNNGGALTSSGKGVTAIPQKTFGLIIGNSGNGKNGLSVQGDHQMYVSPSSFV